MDPGAGVRVSTWTLGCTIGRGGTATVYEAEEAGGRKGALKLMHAHLGPAWRHRFEREARLLAKLDHPGVPALYDFGFHEDCPYLVTELLQGQSLDSVLKEQSCALSLDRTLAYAHSMLETLSAIHACGIVHRDIKPSNVFVTTDDAVKILDFGLGLHEASRSERDGETLGVLGTPAFMPPEQARGRWDLVDARSDIWATGAVLYTLLTRRHVHAASTSNEQMGMAMMCPARPLRDFAPDVDPAIARVIDRALAYDPSERFQSASAFRDALFGGKAVNADAPSEDTLADDREISLAWDARSGRAGVTRLGLGVFAAVTLAAALATLWASEQQSREVAGARANATTARALAKRSERTLLSPTFAAEAPPRPPTTPARAPLATLPRPAVDPPASDITAVTALTPASRANGLETPPERDVAPGSEASAGLLLDRRF